MSAVVCIVPIWCCACVASPLSQGPEQEAVEANASSSWTEDTAYHAWTGYRNYFLGSGLHGGSVFRDYKGAADQWSSFWIEAEEIELAEDAYYWSARVGGDASKYAGYVSDLCKGFAANMIPRFNGPHNRLTGSDINWDWSGNLFNDDLMWSSIAMARAYQITKREGTPNPVFLRAAENQFDTVWTRAQAGNGGLIQSQRPADGLNHGKKWTPNLDSAVNWTFVKAGYLIYRNGGGETYKTRADSVFAWAMAHLTQSTGACSNAGYQCVKVYDADNTGPIPNYGGYVGHKSTLDYAFNYGTALQAIIEEIADAGPNDAQVYEADARYIANYLALDMGNPYHPYDGQFGGYNVLPYYGNNNTDYAGFNGIALRGVGLGLRTNGPDGQPILGPLALSFARTNLLAAWRVGKSSNNDDIMWDDWLHPPPSNYVYHSWDCSGAVVGMLDIPPPGTPTANLVDDD
jgi:hypothetical protein